MFQLLLPSGLLCPPHGHQWVSLAPAACCMYVVCMPSSFPSSRTAVPSAVDRTLSFVPLTPSYIFLCAFLGLYLSTFLALPPRSCLLSPAASLHLPASMILESFFWVEFLICFSLFLNCSSTSLCHKVSFWLLKLPLCPWGPLHRLHSLSALV